MCRRLCRSRRRSARCSALRDNSSAKPGSVHMAFNMLDRSVPGRSPVTRGRRSTKSATCWPHNLSCSGLFGVDFILDGDDVWTLEVNPRYTASVEIVERVHRQSARLRPTPRRATASRRRTEEAERRRFRFTAKRFCSRSASMMISQGSPNWSLAEVAREPWPTLADVSPAGTLIEAGRPILTIFADGATSIGVEEPLRTRIEIGTRSSMLDSN